MSQLDSYPQTLKPYVDLGVDLQHREGQSQGIADCPFCGKVSKFYVAVEPEEKGGPVKWDCKVCGQKGNTYTFLKAFHTEGINSTSDEQYEQLRINRRLLSIDTLKAWGVCVSPISGEWLIPAYNTKGALTQLYHYTRGMKDGKVFMYVRPTAGLDQALFGVPLWKKDKPNAVLAEGCWDGMALYEVMKQTKESPEIIKSGHNGSTKLETLIKFSHTGNESVSLYAATNVVATPGANVFKDSWLPLFEGKNVTIPFDNDHPIRHEKTKALLVPTGLGGVKRIAEKMIASSDTAPDSISYIKWGEGDAKHDASLKDGYDVRDAIAPIGAKDIQTRINLLSSLFQRVKPIPKDWVPARTAKAKEKGGTQVDLLPCSDYRTLKNAWRVAMHWTEGLDATLICMLSSIFSTETVGDQVWLNVLSPPSTGKSVLCEALCMSTEYTHAESTIRGFISGFVEGGDKTKDCGLIPKIKGKTLVTKEGDAFMNAPELSRILGEARDLYDGALRASWRNGVAWRYDNIRFTWILCGTPGKMSKLDQSELGARFLRVTIMERMEDDLEDEIAMRVAHRAYRNVKRKVEEKKADGNVDAAMFTAKQLTGGYINYLRKNADRILEHIEMSDHALKHCTRLGRFVAALRARPSETQDESVAREFSARLVEQLVRLAMCAAGVMNKTRVDADVIRVVTKVALDTAAGRTFNLVKLIYPSGQKGVTTDALALGFDTKAAKLRKDLEFLADPNIRVCETHTVLVRGGIVPQMRWRLTEGFSKLYTAVVINGFQEVGVAFEI